MNSSDHTASAVVREGFERACKDFDTLVTTWGFRRTKKRDWSRPSGEYVEIIHLHRRGSSYGAPINNSVHIRVHFARTLAGAPVVLNGPSSEQVRDARGYTYHLRFNASSWSTYDRCIVDLERIVKEHGLPWFEESRA